MQKAGDIEYEVLEESNGEVRLTCFPPQNVSSKDLELTAEEQEGGGVHVCFSQQGGGKQLGNIVLPGYYFIPSSQARYSSKHNKYSLRLGKLETSNMLAEDDVEDTFHDARSSAGSSQTADQDLSGGDHLQQQQQQAAEGLGGDGESAAAKKKKKKKKKKKAGGGAGGTGGGGEAEEEEEEEGGGSDEAAHERAVCGQQAQEGCVQGLEKEGGGGEVSSGLSKSQKKRQKRKQAEAGGPAAAAAEEAARGQNGNALAAVAEEEEQRGQAEKQGKAEAQAAQTLGATAGRRGKTDPPAGPALVASAAAAATAPSAPSHKGVPVAPVTVDMEQDFAEEPLCTSSVGAPPPEYGTSGMLHGPTIRHSMAKNDMKGEDKWLEAPFNKWELPDMGASTNFAAFGVFDGHGGKQSATYTSKNLLQAVAKRLDRVKAAPPAVPSMEGVSKEDALVWAAQDALIERAPKALHAGFVETDAECKRRFKQSGTTATLVMVVGWEVIVASVGDSCAYMDTGSEIIQISGQHRVVDNSPERERIKAAGGEIEQSEVDGKAVGQLRVWPGGLAMTRSIGDYEAGEPVIGDPEIRQISIPASGARIIIASDGLWDALQPKTVIQKVRRMNTGQATNIAMHTALDKAGVQDDITVVVIDLVPNPNDRLPYPLEHGSTQHTLHHHIHAWRPLEAPSLAWRDRLMDRRHTALTHIMAEIQRQEAVAKAAEEQAAAAAAAAVVASAEENSMGGKAQLYQELSEFKVNVDDLASLGMAEDSAEDGWTTVKGSSRPEEGHAAPSASAAFSAEGADGHEDGFVPGGKSGRGRRGGRGGREGGRFAGQREGGRLGRGRGRGGRFGGEASKVEGAHGDHIPTGTEFGGGVVMEGGAGAVEGGVEGAVGQGGRGRRGGREGGRGRGRGERGGRFGGPAGVSQDGFGLGRGTGELGGAIGNELSGDTSPGVRSMGGVRGAMEGPGDQQQQQQQAGLRGGRGGVGERGRGGRGGKGRGERGRERFGEQPLPEGTLQHPDQQQVGGRGGRGGRGVGRGGSRAQGQQDVQHPAQQQLVQQHPYEQQQQQQQQQHALPPYDQPHASPVFPAPAPPAQQPQYSQPLSCQQLEQQYLQQHQYQHHHQHHQHFQPYPAAPYPQPHLHEHLQQPGAQYAAAPTDNAAAPSAHGANPPSVGNSAGGGGCVEADGSVVGSGREGAHAGAEGGGRGGRGRGRGTGEGGGRGRGMRDGEGGRGGRGGGKGGGRGQKGGGTSNAGMEVHAPLAHDGGPAPTGLSFGDFRVNGHVPGMQDALAGNPGLSNTMDIGGEQGGSEWGGRGGRRGGRQGRGSGGGGRRGGRG